MTVFTLRRQHVHPSQKCEPCGFPQTPVTGSATNGVWVATSDRVGTGVLAIKFGSAVTGPNVRTTLDDLVLCTAYGNKWQTLRFAQARHNTSGACGMVSGIPTSSPPLHSRAKRDRHCGNATGSSTTRFRSESSRPKLQCGSAAFQGGASDPDPSQQQQAPPLTAAFEKVPAKHDGDVGVHAAGAPERDGREVQPVARGASSFAVTNGRVLERGASRRRAVAGEGAADVGERT